MSFLAVASLAAAFLYLENWAIGQFQLGRPAFVLPLAGMLCGQPVLGLWIGLCLELLLLRELPLGASSPPDPVLGGFLGLMVVVRSAAHSTADPELLIFVGLLCAIGFSYLAGMHNHMQRWINTRFWYPRFQRAVQLDQPERMEGLFGRAIAGTFAGALLFSLLVMLLFPPLVGRGLQVLSDSGRDPAYFKWLVLAAAIGTGLKLGTGRRPGLYTVSGWLLGALLLLILEGGLL